MEILLHADNIGRLDNNHWRLRNFSLQLQRGETVGLLGLNGAGKSTTLALLSGALANSEGSISIAGRDLHRGRTGARRHIGFLPETPALYPELTVDENLDVAARLYQLGDIASARRKVKEECALQSVGRRLCGQLSSGYRQRVGIAQAMIHGPDVLILDEPTAGLDPAQAAELRQLIKRFSEQRAVLLASHLLPDIEELCHRVLVLHDGQVALTRDLTGHSIQRIRLQFTRPPGNGEMLEKIPGVRSAKPEKDNWFVLETEPQANELAQEIARRDWGLRAFVPETLDLDGLLRQASGNSHQ